MAFWADGMAYVRAQRQEIALQEAQQDEVQDTGERKEVGQKSRKAGTDRSGHEEFLCLR